MVDFSVPLRALLPSTPFQLHSIYTNPLTLDEIVGKFVQPEGWNPRAGDGVITFGSSWSITGTDSSDAITSALASGYPVYLTPGKTYVVTKPVLAPDAFSLVSSGYGARLVGAFEGYLIQGTMNDIEDTRNQRGEIKNINLMNLFMGSVPVRDPSIKSATRGCVSAKFLELTLEQVHLSAPRGVGLYLKSNTTGSRSCNGVELINSNIRACAIGVMNMDSSPGNLDWSVRNVRADGRNDLTASGESCQIASVYSPQSAGVGIEDAHCWGGADDNGFIQIFKPSSTWLDGVYLERNLGKAAMTIGGGGDHGDMVVTNHHYWFEDTANTVALQIILQGLEATIAHRHGYAIGPMGIKGASSAANNTAIKIVGGDITNARFNKITTSDCHAFERLPSLTFCNDYRYLNGWTGANTLTFSSAGADVRAVGQMAEKTRVVITNAAASPAITLGDPRNLIGVPRSLENDSTSLIPMPLAASLSGATLEGENITALQPGESATIQIKTGATTIYWISMLHKVTLSGAVAPASTPNYIGQRYIDTVAKKVYVATGTASAADWTILN